MISRFEVDDLVSKWASEFTRLRVDLRTTDTNFSVEGLLEVAASGVFRVRLRDAGFIECFLDNSWGFEYFDPTSTRIPFDDRVGRDHDGNIQETAAGLVGRSVGDQYLFVLEIVF